MNGRESNTLITSIYPHEFISKKKLCSASIFSAGFYGLCSTSMAFINKAVVSSYAFHFPFFIMASQMTVSILALEVFRKFGVVQLSQYDSKSATTFLWPSLFYAAHSVTALYALSGMSIPMYTAVKRCAPIVTLILSVILLQSAAPHPRIIVSVVLITVGCVLAGLGDIQFDLMAYGYGAISVVVQGLYLTLVQKCSENVLALQVLYVTSYNTLPIFIILTFFLDGPEVANFEKLTDIGFVFCFIIQICVGVLLNFSLFLCTMKNSALTTSLVGVMKSVLQTIIGSITFGGIAFNWLNVFGITLNVTGGISYVLMKYKQQQQKNTVSKIGV